MAAEAARGGGGIRGLIALAFPGFFLLAGLLLAGASSYSAGEWAAFAWRAETVPATVERIEVVVERRGRRTVSYRPWFRLAGGPEAGTLARSHVLNGWRRAAETQEVTVRHLPGRAWAESEPLPVLFLGPALGLCFAGFFAAAGWLFLPRRLTGIEDAPPRRSVRRYAWGTVTTTESGSQLPGRLKLLLFGSTVSILSLVSLTIFHGELSTALAHREVSATAVGQVVPARPGPSNSPPMIRFETPEGRRLEVAGPRDLSPGASVTVRYLRRDPMSARPTGVWTEWRRSLYAGIPALLICGASGWFLRRKAGAWWREVRRESA